jgi:hypothetical protein
VGTSATKTGVKVPHIGFEQLWRVTLGVKTDEDGLHFVAQGPKFFLDLRHLAQGGGAKIGKLGKAKKHQYHFAFEVCEGSVLAQLIGQAKAFGVVGTG